jgi:hypothetical protein
MFFARFGFWLQSFGDLACQSVAEVARVRCFRHPLGQLATRAVMICQSCNATIDYRFLTNCTQCNCEVEQTSVSPAELWRQIEPVPKVRLDEKKLTWKHQVANLAYVLASSAAGMISGAVVLYFVGVLLYLLFVQPSPNPSVNCARGAAFAFLSIVSGAFLGTVGGSVFAVCHLPCKGAAK